MYCGKPIFTVFMKQIIESINSTSYSRNSLVNLVEAIFFMIIQNRGYFGILQGWHPEFFDQLPYKYGWFQNVDSVEPVII